MTLPTPDQCATQHTKYNLSNRTSGNLRQASLTGYAVSQTQFISSLSIILRSYNVLKLDKEHDQGSEVVSQPKTCCCHKLVRAAQFEGSVTPSHYHRWELPQVSFLSRERFCHNKTHLLSGQKYACRNKMFVMINICCNKHNLVVTNILLSQQTCLLLR